MRSADPRASDLDAALERIVHAPAALATPDPATRKIRPDTPDHYVTTVRRLPAAPADFVPFPDALDHRLQQALASRGIAALYTHQAEAIDHALSGRHIVVITPTASGKTLCYNVPVLQAILDTPSARALYLFPTKALAQDQLAELQALCDALPSHAIEPPGEAPEGSTPERGGNPRPVVIDPCRRAVINDAIGVFTYDGDTPQDARRTIRSRAHIVLSNADMLHSGILPHHPRWAKLFENLRYVVIDELHAYRGVFGSHFCNVLRRLRRICRHYGSSPTFVCSSATIANPRELAERLVEQPFELVDRSGAPRGEKLFVFVNPPVVNHQLGIRRSYLSETRRVAAEFLERDLQTIVFTQSRLATEILTTYLKHDFEGRPGAPERIRGYRGGYLPGRRREIERGLRSGDVRAVVSTNALELGIDIGALDVCVMAGYPGSIAATWQRAGRAGRRSGRSAAILVASSAPIDQFVVRNPSFFFDASPEHALIDPDNLHILVDHVKCAAFELPFAGNEEFGRPVLREVLGVLAEQGLVTFCGGDAAQGGPGSGAEPRVIWTNEAYPADAVSLRSISSDNFVVVDTSRETRVIGETDFTSGPSTLHPKAIYIVEGALFQVENLDFEGRKAFVREIDCDYYTDAITYTRVTMLETFARTAHETPADGVVAAHGEVHVASRVVGFKKIKFYTNENIGSGELDLPEQQMHTTSYWLTIPAVLVASLPYAPDDRRDGLAGLAFAMKQVAQLLLMCDRHDIGISIDTAAGDAPDAVHRIYVYDNYPGGIGFSEPLHRMTRDLLEGTRQLISECECPSGCPACVGPAGQTGSSAKTVALSLLDVLIASTAALCGPAASSFLERGGNPRPVINEPSERATESERRWAPASVENG